MATAQEMKAMVDAYNKVTPLANAAYTTVKRVLPNEMDQRKVGLVSDFSRESAPLHTPLVAFTQAISAHTAAGGALSARTVELKAIADDLKAHVENQSTDMLEAKFNPERWFVRFDAMKEKLTALSTQSASPAEKKAADELVAKLKEVQDQGAAQLKSVEDYFTRKKEEFNTKAYSLRLTAEERRKMLEWVHVVEPGHEVEEDQAAVAALVIGAAEGKILKPLKEGYYQKTGEDFKIYFDGKNSFTPHPAAESLSAADFKKRYGAVLDMLKRNGCDTIEIDFPKGGTDYLERNIKQIEWLMEMAAARVPPMTVKLGKKLQDTFSEVQGMDPGALIGKEGDKSPVSNFLPKVQKIDTKLKRDAEKYKRVRSDFDINVISERDMSEVKAALDTLENKTAQDANPTAPVVPAGTDPRVAGLIHEIKTSAEVKALPPVVSQEKIDETILNKTKEKLNDCFRRLAELEVARKIYAAQYDEIKKNMGELSDHPDRHMEGKEDTLANRAGTLERIRSLLEKEQNDLADRIKACSAVLAEIEVRTTGVVPAATPAVPNPVAPPTEEAKKAKALKEKLDQEGAKLDACKVTLDNKPITDVSREKVTTNRTFAKAQETKAEQIRAARRSG